MRHPPSDIGLTLLSQWPVIVGNLETFELNDLWWWSPVHKCNKFHSGQAFLYPGENQSERLCRDTRAATAGALIQFFAMNFNIVACSVVYFKVSCRPDQHRKWKQT